MPGVVGLSVNHGDNLLEGWGVGSSKEEIRGHGIFERRNQAGQRGKVGVDLLMSDDPDDWHELEKIPERARRGSLELLYHQTQAQIETAAYTRKMVFWMAASVVVLALASVVSCALGLLSISIATDTEPDDGSVDNLPSPPVSLQSKTVADCGTTTAQREGNHGPEWVEAPGC
jgi:hypothetical protein